MAPPTGPVSCLVIPWCSLFNCLHHASLCYFSGSIHSHQKANPGQSVQFPGYYIHQDYSGMVNFNRYVGNAKGIGGMSSLYFHMARMPGLVPRKTQRSRQSTDIQEHAHDIHCATSTPLSAKPTSAVKSVSWERASVCCRTITLPFWCSGSLSPKVLIFANKSLRSN